MCVNKNVRHVTTRRPPPRPVLVVSITVMVQKRGHPDMTFLEKEAEMAELADGSLKRNLKDPNRYLGRLS